MKIVPITGLTIAIMIGFLAGYYISMPSDNAQHLAQHLAQQFYQPVLSKLN